MLRIASLGMTRGCARNDSGDSGEEEGFSALLVITCKSGGQFLVPAEKFCWIIAGYSCKILVLMKLSQKHFGKEGLG